MSETTTAQTEVTKVVPLWSTVQAGEWNVETQKVTLVEGVNPTLVVESVVKQNIALSEKVTALTEENAALKKEIVELKTKAGIKVDKLELQAGSVSTSEKL